MLGYALCKKRSLSTDDFILLDAYLVAFGFLGAKALYIIVSFPATDFSRVFQSIAQFNAFVSSGFVFYGGLLGGLAAFPFVKKVHRVDTRAYMPLLAPCLCLAHAFGRIGCSLAGCCHGKVTAGALYFLYRHSLVAPNNVRLFPVQGIESLCLFVLCAVLIVLALHSSGRTVIAVYITAYSALRFILEFFRGDAERGMVGFLSTSQIISVLLFAGICVLWLLRRMSASNLQGQKSSAPAKGGLFSFSSHEFTSS